MTYMTGEFDPALQQSYLPGERPKRKPYVAGPRVDYVAQSLETLETAVGQIQDSDNFRRYLDAQARFHRYSPNNVLLILTAYPEATQVAGYNTWKSLGRQVREGESAIRILAPLKKKETDDQGEEKYRVFGYRAVPVFALEQTEGKELPSVLVPELMGDEGKELYDRLTGVLKDDGVSVTRGHERFDRSPSTMGFFEPQNKAIYHRQAAMLQEVKTLAHEAAHFYGGHERSSPDTETEAGRLVPAGAPS